MARFARIDAGRVTNIIEADAEFAASISAIDATGANIGDLWDGETFTTPPAQPRPIPTEVTMRQACLAMEGAALLDDVEAIVATLPRVYQIEWQRASTVLRSNALVEMVRQQNSMTDAQIDDLFVTAATL